MTGVPNSRSHGKRNFLPKITFAGVSFVLNMVLSMDRGAVGQQKVVFQFCWLTSLTMDKNWLIVWMSYSTIPYLIAALAVWCTSSLILVLGLLLTPCIHGWGLDLSAAIRASQISSPVSNSLINNKAFISVRFV